MFSNDHSNNSFERIEDNLLEVIRGAQRRQEKLENVIVKMKLTAIGYSEMPKIDSSKIKVR